MDIAYKSFVDSEPFKFLVGPTAKPFYMHGGLATKLSDPMAALLGGGMVEATNRYAVLKDTDEDTFVRVIQFAYTGDYAVAEPEPDHNPSEPDNVVDESFNNLRHAHPSAFEDIVAEGETTESVPIDPEPTEEYIEEEAVPYCEWCGRNPFRKRNHKWVESGKTKTVVSKAQEAWDSFKKKADIKKTMEWKLEVNEDQHQNYTPVFLCHAKLYAFADQYLIEPLRGLVLQKLRLTLSRFKLHQQRVGDVVELLKYTYANTPCRDPKIDQLRDLISDYLVCHIEKIVHHEEFIKLLDNGDVAKDFLPKLVALRLD
ncbi:hypothetical protein AYO21_01298 [Fonsecaea monophora]|uniref:BTB domain-containing protein n=1 Tax=Fonsecaea monophora TaxID=254056 RepID=A0A177FLU9_9EURO|nr:hypothetical protein AYO21_01298 [Fonsecaea monophora]OAG44302.1 hypothetical protein AYO21_01298 [Fonsecaea monophora]